MDYAHNIPKKDISEKKHHKSGGNYHSKTCFPLTIGAIVHPCFTEAKN